MRLLDLHGRQLERGGRGGRIGLSGAIPGGPSAVRVALRPRDIAGQVPGEEVRWLARQDDAQFSHRAVVGPRLLQPLDEIESEGQLRGLQLYRPEQI